MLFTTAARATWCGASFHHSTSRPVDYDKFMARFAAGEELPDWLRTANGTIPPDMQEHTHVFVFNATEDPQEARIKAGEFAAIKKDGEYYTAVFYAKLAKKLQDLGYAIDRQGGKRWEIAGISQSTIDKFNKRSAEIEAEHRRRLRDDPDYRAEYKHELAAKTRSKKQKELTPAQLREAWDAQLTDEEREALAEVYAKGVTAGAEVTAAEAVGYAIHHCSRGNPWSASGSWCGSRCSMAWGASPPKQVRAEMPGQNVLLAEKDGRLMATTRDVHWKERTLTNFAKNGLGAVRAVGIDPGLSRVLPNGDALDDDQWNTVTALLESCDRLQMVDAAAGVGKSTMLSVYNDGMQRAGKHVTYLATTTPAVGVLRHDGFAAESVAKFLMSEKMQDAASGGYVVVDESSMLGLRDAFDLFKLAKENDLKLVLLGDSRQHSSVTAGAVMRLLREYGGVTPYQITTIKRQENKHHKKAVELFFAGKTTQGFDLLDKKLGWVKEIANADERYKAMAAEYVGLLKAGTKWSDILLISPTHAEGERVTAAIRGLLRQENRLGKKDHEFTRWVSADLTEAEKGDARKLPAWQRGHGAVLSERARSQGGVAGGCRRGRRILGAAETGSEVPGVPQGNREFCRGDILRFTANGESRTGTRYATARHTRSPASRRRRYGWITGGRFPATSAISSTA